MNKVDVEVKDEFYKLLRPNQANNIVIQSNNIEYWTEIEGKRIISLKRLKNPRIRNGLIRIAGERDGQGVTDTFRHFLYVMDIFCA